MTFRHLASRLRALVSRRRVESELDEEIRFHLEEEADDLGLTDRHVVDQQAVRVGFGLVGGERSHGLIQTGIDVSCKEARRPPALQKFLECQRGVRHRVTG